VRREILVRDGHGFCLKQTFFHRPTFPAMGGASVVVIMVAVMGRVLMGDRLTLGVT
jgi:hypothetical protein